MNIIKLDATRSTNETLKTLWQEKRPEDGTVIWALDQYGGRGQKGTSWESEPGKNLTFSVLKKFDRLNVQQHFALNMAVSMALYEGLIELGIPEIAVKWPNDIMSGSGKICGILIENFVKATKLHASVIGIGLNTNQEDFGHLRTAASLKTVTGNEFDLENLLAFLLRKMEVQSHRVESASLAPLKTDYESVLYRRGKISSFEFPDGKIRKGIIRGVSDSGRLLVESHNDLQSYDLKEIKLLD